MKYIRTKDGIYKATEINGMVVARGGVAYSCDIADVHFPIVFKEQDIIKQADTIEELCDEFVLHYEGTMKASIPIPWASYERRDDNWQKHKEKLTNELNNEQRKAIVYGAIWTDKGLIYVAKMNEKGELELL